MIKAKLIFTENKAGKVETEIVSYPDNTETELEIYMLVTFMAFNNCMADKKNFEPLMKLLKNEIDTIIDGAND